MSNMQQACVMVSGAQIYVSISSQQTYGDMSEH